MFFMNFIPHYSFSCNTQLIDIPLLSLLTEKQKKVCLIVSAIFLLLAFVFYMRHNKTISASKISLLDDEEGASEHPTKSIPAHICAAEPLAEMDPLDNNAYSDEPLVFSLPHNNAKKVEETSEPRKQEVMEFTRSAVPALVLSEPLEKKDSLENISWQSKVITFFLANTTEVIEKPLRGLRKCAPSYISPMQRLGKEDKPKNITWFAKDITFYPYNAEEVEESGEAVNDGGWGCAWRSIQTSLSSYGDHYKRNFSDLYHTYGKRSKLCQVYKDKYGEEMSDNIPPEKPWTAPYERQNGYAEPFIGEMVMHDLGLSADLFFLKDPPKNCDAPRGAYHHCFEDFAGFRKRLCEHFTVPRPAPVMVDNGWHCINIIGMGIEGDFTHLWLADTRSRIQIKYEGESTTRLQQWIVLTVDKEGSPVHAYPTDDKLYYFDRYWAILFPKEIISFES